MEVLLLRGNFFSLIVAWDWLGISSYYLVSYYGDFVSLGSGVITFLANRLGDRFIMLSIGFYSCYGGGFWFVGDFVRTIFVMFLLLGLCSKRAQFPYSFWLPVAISAPTPVSSLVHSSTLVTAGVVSLFRVEYFLNYDFISLVFIVLGIVTMVLGSFMGIFSLDLKRLVAYSTLSQLGFMVVAFTVGGPEISFFHIVVHAFFKSLIFIMVGLVMMESFLIQNIGIMGVNFKFGWFFSFVMLFCLFNLGGLPLFSGWISKDLVLEFMGRSSGGVFYSFIFWLSCSLTLIYCYRIYLYVYGGGSGVLFRTSFFYVSDLMFFFLVSLVSLIMFSLLSCDLFEGVLLIRVYGNGFNVFIVLPAIVLLVLVIRVRELFRFSFVTGGINFIFLRSLEILSFLVYSYSCFVLTLDLAFKISSNFNLKVREFGDISLMFVSFVLLLCFFI
jgi:NADH-ubiquinone oxidoreductase chain 5